MRIQFDSGTLVLRGEASAARPQALKGSRWDPRIGHFRAPAYRHRQITAALRANGTDFVDEVTAASIERERLRPVDLRPYQCAALLAWAAGQRGVVVLPTGSGKTRLACAAISTTRVPALCLVPTRSLLHQWRAELARHYQGPIGCLGDGQHDITEVTVATFESAYRWMPRIGAKFGLLIVDEAHHFGAGMRDEALEMCAAQCRLGLTATEPEGPQLERLQELLGPIVFALRVGDLAGEWLSEFDSVALALRLSDAEQQQYDEAVHIFREVYRSFRTLGGARWSDFVAMASRSEQGRAALAAFRWSRRLTSYPEAKRLALRGLLAQHHDSRTLIFTSDNEAAYAIAREHLIMPMTCDIDRKEREQALAAFRAGDLRALVSAQVLNEGIDVPDAQRAIIVGGVRGQREHVQRVGRLLRPSPGKRAQVYELVMMGTHEQRKAKERRGGLVRAGAPSALRGLHKGGST